MVLLATVAHVNITVRDEPISNSLKFQVILPLWSDGHQTRKCLVRINNVLQIQSFSRSFKSSTTKFQASLNYVIKIIFVSTSYAISLSVSLPRPPPPRA